MSTWTTPSAKVVTAALAAFVVALALAVSEDGVPDSVSGWVKLVAKALGSGGVVGTLGYLKPETRPSVPR